VVTVVVDRRTGCGAVRRVDLAAASEFHEIVAGHDGDRMAFDDIAELGQGMAGSVTITGTRSVDVQAEPRLIGLFDDYLRSFADPDARFYLGVPPGSVPRR
jgi:hypothetical protein